MNNDDDLPDTGNTPVLGASLDEEELFVRTEADSLLKRQGERVRVARVQAGKTISDVATATGLHTNTIGRIERGQSEASVEQLLRIARALRVDAVTLSLFGGEPVVSGDDEEFVLIDHLDVDISAGNGSMVSNAEVLGRFAFRRSWLEKRHIKPEHARVVSARGRSMADKINDGDILLVDIRTRTLQEDGIYAIERDGLDYVKLLQRDFSTGGVHVISYNPEFKPLFIPADQVDSLRITGRVVWRGGDV